MLSVIVLSVVAPNKYTQPHTLTQRERERERERVGASVVLGLEFSIIIEVTLMLRGNKGNKRQAWIRFPAPNVIKLYTSIIYECS
jgi:hypothetical protein